MHCMICESKIRRFLKKRFEQDLPIRTIHYDRCVNCGFVCAREIQELKDSEWEKLNREFHSKFLGTQYNELDPNWINRLNKQSVLLDNLSKDGILNRTVWWLDYACGDGKLVALLNSKGIVTCGYDKYSDRYNYHLLNRYFDVVVNTSYFEHARRLDDLEIVNDYVLDALALNTLIRSEIPNDPNWFYFLPVHCSFFTNRAAGILFDRWGYKSCIYSPEARMWVWFKKTLDPSKISDYYLFKEQGFIGYW